MLIAATALTMAACGSSGGSSTPSIPLVPKPTATPGVGQPTAQQQSSVPSSSGGTVSASLPNNGTLSVQVPANALASNTTVTVYAYTSASQLPGSPFKSSSSIRKPSASTTSNLPSDGVFLAAFAVDTNGVSALAPFAVSETLQASVPSGDVVRVARYGSSGWSDVDTATVQGTAATNDKNAKYVSVSPGGTANPYVIYAVPSKDAASPAQITITSTSATQLAIGQTALFTSSGADAHGNPLPFTPAFDTDNHAMATASAVKGNPFGVNVTAANQGGTVHLISTDARTGTTGNTAVTIYTQRPSSSGDTFKFTGTLTQSDVYSYPTPNPLPADSKTAQVTQTVTVSATSDPFGSGTTVQDFNVQEQDAFPTQTLSSSTDSYFVLGAANANSVSQYMLLGSNSTDDQGNTSSVQYASPGVVVDQLPEAQGQSWSNSPALTLNENYVDLESVKRSVNSDGSFSDTENMYNAPIPSPSPGNPTQDYPNTTVTANGYADGHATMSVQFALPDSFTSYYYVPAGTTEEIDLAVTAPGSNGIDFMTSRPWFPALGQQQPGFTNSQAIPVWYPAPNGSLYTESDNNLGSVAIPASCNVPSSIGTTGNKIEQKSSTVDPMMGTLETVQTDQYVVTGYGPVCVTVADTESQYYNYQLDQAYSGNFNYFPVASGTPLVTTTVSETLALQSAGVANQSRTRDAMSASHAAVPPVAIAAARQIVQRRVHHTMAIRRVQTLHQWSLIRGKGAKH